MRFYEICDTYTARYDTLSLWRESPSWEAESLYALVKKFRAFWENARFIAVFASVHCWTLFLIN
jgi:hypothetical protein